jgi:hypothetical protein
MRLINYINVLFKLKIAFVNEKPSTKLIYIKLIIVF